MGKILKGAYTTLVVTALINGCASAGPNIPMGEELLSSTRESSPEIVKMVGDSGVECGLTITSNYSIRVHKYVYTLVMERTPGNRGLSVILQEEPLISSIKIVEVDGNRSRAEGFSNESLEILQCFEHKLHARLPGLFRGGVLKN